MNIAVCFGTRPEYLKVLPFIKTLAKANINHKVYYIEQHATIAENIAESVIRVNLPQLASNRLNSIGAAILIELEKVFDKGHSHIVLQGDTTTALFCAIYGFYNKIKVVHIEAGLRTYDLSQPWPEEGNRQMISRITDFHFTPHAECEDILKAEKASGKIYTVGNTILDLVKSYDLKPTITNTILITFHRRENWEKIDIFIGEIKNLLLLKPDLEFIWPLHPNPDLQKKIRASFENTTNLKLISPLPHREFTELISEAMLIITDSGGLQEEASFLGKQCLVLRESTERYHIPYPYIHLVKDISTLSSIIQSLNIELLEPCQVYGDGSSSQKILSILINEVTD